MNWKQKIVLCMSMIIVVLMLIFPPIGPFPVIVVVGGKEVHRYTQYLGLLVEDYGHIRFDLLAIQYIIVAVITVGLIFMLRGKKDEKPKDDQKQ